MIHVDVKICIIVSPAAVVDFDSVIKTRDRCLVMACEELDIFPSSDTHAFYHTHATYE